MPPTNMKLTGLSVVATAAALFFGYAVFIFSPLNFKSLALLIAGVILFLIIFIFQALLIRNLYVQAGVCFLEMIAIITPFYKSLSLLTISAAAAVFFMLFTAGLNARRREKNTLKIDFPLMSKPTVSQAATALILFGVAIYAASLSFQDVVNFVIKSGEPILQNFTTQFMPIVPKATFAQAQNLISSKLMELPENIKKYIILGFGVTAFFTIKSLFFIINWLVAIFSSFIYKILLATKFIKVVPEETTKETISF
ncbi:MAG: hypothetical protein A2745_02320 [Candidatus Harrisonbacteria bacterium RIFCSPHIGHO2_01_FULL_44_13]|nr:MAG: hypothetical protein A2745_02320 [Candidatus Harrisonbacteria bacterium RIFCSPHIGHO2_01_FULL_44_13]